MSSPEKPRVVVTGSAGAARKGSTARKPSVKSSSSVSEKELIEALADCIAVGLEAYFQYIARMNALDREELAMTSEEASAIATPVAKLIERHASSSAAGFVAGSKDWIVAVAAIMAYTDRAAPIIRRNAEARKAEQGQRIKERQQKGSPNVNGIRPNPQEASAPVSVVGIPGAGYGLGSQQTID